MTFILDDDRCAAMTLHCKTTLMDRAKQLKIVVRHDSVFPIVKQRSVLHLRPVFNIVNTFPIDEDSTFQGVFDVHRPMYYCELKGVALNEAWKRNRLAKKRKKRKGV